MLKYNSFNNGNCLKTKLDPRIIWAVNTDAVFVQEEAVTLCFYRMMIWVSKTRVESETKLKMFSSSSTSMGTQWGGEDAFLLLDTRMSIMPLKCSLYFYWLDFHCTGTERWQMLIPQRLGAALPTACCSKPSVSLSKPRNSY